MSASTTDRSSREQQEPELLAIATRFVSVVGVRQITAGVRRITFSGADLGDLTWLSPDQFFYLLLPPTGSTQMSIDHSFTWEHYRQMPVELQPRGAYYTARHLRTGAHELDIDVVLHGDDGEASAWARRAVAGDVAALWGPRTAWQPPVDTQWYLLVADETGLPAVAAILEHLPTDARVLVVAEVSDVSERQSLSAGPNTTVRWLHRHGAAAGTTTLLVDEVRSSAASSAWPSSVPYAWGGAEASAMTSVRRFLRDDVGLTRDQVSMVGYWRRTHDPTGDITGDITDDITGDGAR